MNQFITKELDLIIIYYYDLDLMIIDDALANSR